MAEEIINRVEKSGLVTIDLAEYYHNGERIVWDIADYLFRGMNLREKEYRQVLKDTDWSAYEGRNVAITCSADAIVPTWAYMLTATYMADRVNMVVVGDLATLEYALFRDALEKIELGPLKDAKVVVKGCGSLPVPPSAYVELTLKLQPVVASLMYGEPCSTVPLYKKARSRPAERS
ncbi:MAG: DUF2480 family protein [Cyclobacteriaceae bacterium]